MAITHDRPSGSGHDAPAAPTAAPADPDRSGWGAKIHSVRFRVVAAMLVMMLAGLVTAGLIAFTVEFQESDARVDQALLDKAHAVVKLVRTESNLNQASYSERLHEAGRRGYRTARQRGHGRNR